MAKQEVHKAEESLICDHIPFTATSGLGWEVDIDLLLLLFIKCLEKGKPIWSLLSLRKCPFCSPEKLEGSVVLKNSSTISGLEYSKEYNIPGGLLYLSLWAHRS